jgi:hypothetical protein
MSTIPKIIKQHIQFFASLVELPIGSVKVCSAELDDAAYHADGKPIIESCKELKAAASIFIYTTKQRLSSGNEKLHGHFFVPIRDSVWDVVKKKKSSKPDDTVNQS